MVSFGIINTWSIIGDTILVSSLYHTDTKSEDHSFTDFLPRFGKIRLRHYGKIGKW